MLLQVPLSSSKKADPHLANIKIDEFRRLVSNKATKITPNKAMPPDANTQQTTNSLYYKLVKHCCEEHVLTLRGIEPQNFL